jgi:hypothetical protein
MPASGVDCFDVLHRRTRHSHWPLPAEHNLLLTHPDVVVDALVNWLGLERAAQIT